MTFSEARPGNLSRVCVILLGTLLMGGCTSDQPGKQYELRTDMYTQPSYRHNEDPRPAAAGTVADRGTEAPIPDSASAARLENPYTFAAGSADTAKARCSSQSRVENILPRAASGTDSCSSVSMPM